MPRIKQKKALRGSQKWLQILVNEHPHILSNQLANRLKLAESDRISFLSPLKGDDYAEYSDEAFINKLEAKLTHTPLLDFWPRRGAVWDGLARTDGGLLILLEAKAHIGELLSPPSFAKEPSLTKICKSLNKTKKILKVKSNTDWATTFYQYTNRLSHLYFLREINKLPAYLIFLYFINDQDIGGPTTKEEWEGAISILRMILGLNRHSLSDYVLDTFIDVALLQK